MPPTKKTPSDGSRQKHTKVKTARGRTISSTRWLQRQLNDPYVTKAKQDGYRSRAAYKLLELDEKFKFLKPGKYVIDLGAAPGGWTQVAVNAVQADKPKGGKVVGIDLTEIEPIAHATLMQQDFMSDEAPALLQEALGRKADIVLSDMAAPSCGHQQTDHIRIVLLCEAAYDFAVENLVEGGVFIAKILRGGTENTLLNAIKKHFTTVKHVKPAASRANSTEMYIVATGFKGKINEE